MEDEDRDSSGVYSCPTKSLYQDGVEQAIGDTGACRASIVYLLVTNQSRLGRVN